MRVKVVEIAIPMKAHPFVKEREREGISSATHIKALAFGMHR